MGHPDEHVTPQEIAELGALLLAERPQISPTFAAELDARVEARFERQAAPRAVALPASRRWRAFLTRPLLPAAAASLAVGLVAVVVALNVGGTSMSGNSSSVKQGGTISGPTAGSADSAAGATSGAVADAATPERAAKRAAPLSGRFDSTSSRKVERSASIELGAARDKVDDAAQDVLGTVARFGGIVDQSSVASGTDGGNAQFALRIPSARLQPALAALSQLPDTHVLTRSDDQQDVNQAYVSIRRRLADATAARAGVVRALAAATSEDETLRLQARLDQLERTIAATERAQRGLNRRIDFSTVTLSIRTDSGNNTSAPFSVGRAFHDAGRVLSVAAGVAVIAAAALAPLALLLACTLPLAHALRRRRREQALDAT